MSSEVVLERQNKVMELFLKGLTQAQIAAELDYSPETIRRDMRAVRDELRPRVLTRRELLLAQVAQRESTERIVQSEPEPCVAGWSGTLWCEITASHLLGRVVALTENPDGSLTASIELIRPDALDFLNSRGD